MNLYIAHTLIKKIKLDFMVQLHLEGAKSLFSNTYHKIFKPHQIEAFFSEEAKKQCIDDLAHFLCKIFSDEELKELVKFYSSPIGQKMMDLDTQKGLERIIKSSIIDIENKIIQTVKKED